MYEIVDSPMVTAIKIYDKDKGESSEGRTRYTTSLLLTNLSMGEGRLHFVQGRLDDEMNALIFDLCRAKGYKQVQFEVPTGTKASRRAKFMYTFDGLDRYVMNLENVGHGT